jgi:hypothetical protein
MSTNKLRVIQDFEKLSKEIQEQIKLTYPEGFSQHLIQFTNKEGRLVSALPFETDEKIYLVRMTTQEALDIILDDDDYNDDGMLKVASKEQFADKYAELDYMSDAVSDDDDLSDDYDEPYDDDDDEEDDD